MGMRHRGRHTYDWAIIPSINSGRACITVGGAQHLLDINRDVKFQSNTLDVVRKIRVEPSALGNIA
jgi:hypothetical protein